MIVLGRFRDRIPLEGEPAEIKAKKISKWLNESQWLLFGATTEAVQTDHDWVILSYEDLREDQRGFALGAIQMYLTK